MDPVDVASPLDPEPLVDIEAPVDPVDAADVSSASSHAASVAITVSGKSESSARTADMPRSVSDQW